MKAFSSVYPGINSNAGVTVNKNYEKSEIIIPYNHLHENINVFNYDEQNTQNNGWNCYKNIIINGKPIYYLK